MELYTGIAATGWYAMKSTAENQPELLEKDLKSISWHHPPYFYQTRTGHITTVEGFNLVDREGHILARTIKESIYIRVNKPTLNRNIAKYNLPHIWDKILFTIPELKFKN